MKEKVFLIFNTACFGDNLVCNALCQNIKRIYKDAKVVFICDKPFYDVAKYQYCVDDVVIYDKRGEHKGLKGFIKFIKNFKYKKSFASFITYRNVRNLWVSILTGSKYIFENSKLKNTIPAQQQILNMLKKLTKKPIENVAVKYIPEESEFPFEKDSNYIALCTLSKKQTKDMPIETAVEIIKKLKDYKIIYTGKGDSAIEYSNKLKENGCNFIDLVNKTSIPELANILKNCKALISVDTGTMHLGYSIQTPTIAIFYENDMSKCWAPDSNLYKTVLIEQNQSADNIVEKTLNLIK